MCHPAEAADNPQSGSASARSERPETNHKVTFCYRGVSSVVTTTATTDLITSLEDAGLDVPYSCREGACTACVALLQDGEINAGANDVLAQADQDAGYFLPCISTPRSRQVTFSFDE